NDHVLRQDASAVRDVLTSGFDDLYKPQCLDEVLGNNYTVQTVREKLCVHKKQWFGSSTTASTKVARWTNAGYRRVEPSVRPAQPCVLTRARESILSAKVAILIDVACGTG